MGLHIERRTAWGYLIGIALSILTLLPLAWHGSPIAVAMVPAVMLAAYVGGVYPGLAATVLSAIGAALLSDPVGSVRMEHPFDVVRVVSFVAVGGTISLLIEALHRGRSRAERDRDLIKRSEQRFTRAFYSSPVAKAIIRISDRIVVDVNDAYLACFGVEREAILHHTTDAVGINPTGVGRERLLAELREKGEIRNLELDLPSSTGIRSVLLSTQVIDLEGTPHALTTFVDMTDRKRAEAAARASDGRLRELAGAINEVFWMTDPDTRELVYVSPAYERLWGRPCSTLEGAPIDLLDAIHPADRDGLRERAGTRQDQSSYVETYRIVRPDGSVRWIRDKAFPVHDESSNRIRMGGVAEDITEQRVLEDQLRQTQKLESIGLFAGGIAHDFNNILGAIAANSELLLDALPANSTDRVLVDDIDAAVVRASAMTRQLLSFSRKQVSDPIVLDLNRAVEDIRRMLRRMVGEAIVVQVSLDPDIGRIRCDPSQLVQVLMNLAVNARDAMPSGGTLTIETRQVEDHAVLLVKDTGCGMTDAVKVRLFEPFFTTKEQGYGTGLGLPVVHGIVEQARGKIEVESEPDRGATFRLSFPTVSAPAEPALDLIAAGAQGKERILLVDDDWHVRTATARGLRARGYTVIEAEDARTALRLFGEHARTIDILVTDVVMPGMDGRQLAEIAKLRSPGLRVLYISGYTEDEVVHHAARDTTVGFLEKPFRLHAFAARIRQMLDAGDSQEHRADQRLRIQGASS